MLFSKRTSIILLNSLICEYVNIRCFDTIHGICGGDKIKNFTKEICNYYIKLIEENKIKIKFIHHIKIEEQNFSRFDVMFYTRNLKDIIN